MTASMSTTSTASHLASKILLYLKMKRTFHLFLISATLLGLVGCASTSNPAITSMTSLEVQSFQKKSFEAPQKTTFAATLSTFQDLGYIIKSASAETGFIVAESPYATNGNMVTAFFGLAITNGNVSVNASIEGFPNGETHVRLSFVETVEKSNFYGQTTRKNKPITDPKMYERAFDKIAESVFIRQAA